MLAAINDKAKCAGQAPDGSQVCSDRGRCGRFLRPGGEYQVYYDFWKSGDSCQNYESVSAEHHQTEDFNEARIDVIGANGNDGLHYGAV